MGIKKGFQKLARFDGWKNTVTKLNVSGRDKRLADCFYSEPIPYDEAARLWQGDDMMAKIVEKIPDEMMREGFRPQLSGDDATEKEDQILNFWKSINLFESLWYVLAYENAYGGGAVLLGANDGQDIAQELNIDRVSDFGFTDYLEPRELIPHTYQIDPMLPGYGQVETWRLNPITTQTATSKLAENQIIHSSRLLIFPGIRVTKRDINGNHGWGTSKITRVYSVIRDYQSAWGSTSALLQDFAQAVVKMEGLAELVAQDNGDLLRTRIESMDYSRSVLRMLVLDSNEDFERKPTPITGLPDVLDRFMTRVAAAADMPATILFGMSPAGLNATGESDMRNFYDRVASLQEKKLAPHLNKVLQITMKVLGISSDSSSVVFNPLWQQSDEEIANARNKQADTDTKYIQANVLSPVEVAQSRFGGDSYSFETSLDVAERSAFEEMERKRQESVLKGYESVQQLSEESEESPSEGNDQDE